MITGGDLRQSRLDVGYKTFTISPWWVNRVKEFGPLIISIDTKGKNLFEMNKSFFNPEFKSEVRHSPI